MIICERPIPPNDHLQEATTTTPITRATWGVTRAKGVTGQKEEKKEKEEEEKENKEEEKKENWRRRTGRAEDIEGSIRGPRGPKK